MLHYSTIESGTLEILNRLMSLPELKEFQLVGGTALSLYYGHRLSIDLDLFNPIDFELEELAQNLSAHFPSFGYTIVPKVGVFGFIDDVKVDFVKHHHFELIAPAVVHDGIRLYNVADIAAMKVAAILKRGVKKDFWDMAELLQQFTLAEIIGFYTQKYPTQQLLISVPQALIYFVDAEESITPVSLKNQTWEGVKDEIRSKVNDYLQ